MSLLLVLACLTVGATFAATQFFVSRDRFRAGMRRFAADVDDVSAFRCHF